MSGSLCNSFGSLPAGVHERPRKWYAPQRLRTKRTFVPLWPGQAIGGTFVSLCSIAFFAIGGDAATMVCLSLWWSASNPPKQQIPEKCVPFKKRDLVRRSSRSAWLPSFSSLQSSCSSMFQGGFLFLYKKVNSMRGWMCTQMSWRLSRNFQAAILSALLPR